MNHERWKASKMVMVLLVLVAVCAGPSAATESVGLCDGFRKLASASQQKGFDQYRLWDEPGSGGRYSNIDVDGDDISDVIVQSCPGSKETPSDPCMISIRLSSSAHGRKGVMEEKVSGTFLLTELGPGGTIRRHGTTEKVSGTFVLTGTFFLTEADPGGTIRRHGTPITVHRGRRTVPCAEPGEWALAAIRAGGR